MSNSSVAHHGDAPQTEAQNSLKSPIWLKRSERAEAGRTPVLMKFAKTTVSLQNLVADSH